jgi:rRNA maturation RNase YbeY
MRIEISNRQSLSRVDAPRLGRFSRFIMQRVCALRPARRWNDISLVLADDAAMRRLSASHHGRAEPTDVLSFRYEPMPGDRGRCSGEVIVNVECALRRSCPAAGRRSRTAGGVRPQASRELALYVAHGCDHLTGAGDARRSGRLRMRRRELRWLKQAEERGLLTGLICPP